MKKVLYVSLVLVPVLLAFFLLKPVFFTEKESQPNTLSEQEMQEGWKLLFDGKTTQNWHTYGGKEVGPAWRVIGDELLLFVPERAGNKAPGGGDLVTDEEFEGDFEFKIDWKVSRLSNSGIFFFVTEDTAYKEIYHTGMELQVFDDTILEGVEEENSHRAGDLFSLASVTGNPVLPVGQWNQVHVIHRNRKFQVFMNGEQIHDLDLNSAEWKKAVAGSKLSTAPISQGKFTGRIGLQDWGSSVSYRNIKIREL